MEIKDDRFIDGEEGIEIAIREAVRMFGVGHEAEKIDNVDEADFQVGKMLLENSDTGERLHGGDIAGAGNDGVGHGEILKMVLLVGNDDVDVIEGAQAMIGNAEQAVGVGRKIDAS